ncbi:adrenoceptor beta 3b [Brachyhypopomus gauderio]|uniref:adrenoceptor beta 3b n=1 Tax=Brachyhypopomus gauderio TaxID=698409 RepID=UPI0040411D4D
MLLQNISSNISYKSASLEPLLILPLALIIFLTVGGNLLVILAVSLTPQLHTPTSVFITSLACADLVVGCVVEPLSIPLLLHEAWTLGEIVCDLWLSVDVLCVTASINTLCAIAVERYVAVTRPLRRRALLGRQRAWLVVGGVWLCSTLVSFVPIMGGNVTSPKSAEFNSSCCFITNPVYGIISSAFSFYVPLLVMLFLYGQVFVIARRQVKLINKDSLRFLRDQIQHAPPAGHPPPAGHSPPAWPESSQNRSSHRSRRTWSTWSSWRTWHVVHQHTALKTLGLVIGVFTICWLPFFVANVVKAVEPNSFGNDVFMQLNWLGYVNSGLNPIIYCHNSEYRAAFRNILRRIRIEGLSVWKQVRFWCCCQPGPLGCWFCSCHTGAEITEQE